MNDFLGAMFGVFILGASMAILAYWINVTYIEPEPEPIRIPAEYVPRATPNPDGYPIVYGGCPDDLERETWCCDPRFQTDGEYNEIDVSACWRCCMKKLEGEDD